MTKEALLVSAGALSREQMEQTIAQFEKNHDDLLAGNAERGISKMDAPAITLKMREVGELWQQFKVQLEGVSPGSPMDLATLQQRSVDLLKTTNEAVGLMAESATHLQALTLKVAFACVLAILGSVPVSSRTALSPEMACG